MNKPEGRPSLLTPATALEICRLIELGFTYESAAEGAGVSYSSFNNWRNRAKEAEKRLEDGVEVPPEDLPYLQFLQAVKKAEKRAKEKHLANIDKASKRSWYASAWILERRYPNEYGRARLEVSGPEGSAIPVKAEGLNDEERTNLLQLAAELGLLGK